MSSANPYARFVAGQDPKEVIRQTPQRLKQAVARLGDAGMQRSPAPGKWTAAQILAHLADTEIAFAYRLRQALAEKHHVVQPYDQDAFARSYSAYTGVQALEAFNAFRQWNVLFVNHLDEAAWSRELIHPERGKMMMATLVETMAGHDVNHLQQLEAMAS